MKDGEMSGACRTFEKMSNENKISVGEPDKKKNTIF
jgi:hypothetical protein